MKRSSLTNTTWLANKNIIFTFFRIKIFILSSTLFLSLENVGAQAYTLSGTIKDQEGNALTGASVSVKGSTMGAATNLEGEYEIRGLYKGEYTVVVSYLGMERVEKEVEISENTVMDFQLKQKALLGETVVVTATRADKHSPFAHTNITRDQLEKNNTGEEIPFLLSLTPSLVSTSENGTALGNTAFRIRGSDPSRLNVTVNGIPLNDAESQTVFWVNMSDFAESVDNIQVQRGVGTSTNGAAAFGASLNLQTSTLSQDPFAELISSAGSFRTFKNSLKLNSGLINNRFAFETRVSRISSEGYIKHSEVDHQSLYFSGGYFNRNTTLKLVVWNNDARTGISWWGVPDYMIETDRRYNPAGEYYDSEGNLNYYEDQTDNYNQTHYQLLLSQRLGRRITANAALHYTRGYGYYEQFMDDANWFHTTAFADYGFGNLYYLTQDTLQLFASDLVRQRWLDNHFYGATWSVIYHSGRLRTALGGGINRYDGDHYGLIQWVEFNPGIPKDHEYYNNKGIKDDVNVYAKADYAFTSNLRAFADIQYRKINYELTGESDVLFPLDEMHEYQFLNPKLGISFSRAHYRVYASWAVANREPTRANIKDAAGDNEATPSPERLNNLELGYLYFSPEFSGGVNAYYMIYKDQLVPTGEKSDVGYDIMTNVDDSYRLGVELMASWKPSASWKIDLNATFSENRIVSFTEFVDSQTETIENSHIAYSPPVLVNSSLEWIPFSKTSVRITGRFVGEQYYDNTSEEGAKIEPYFLTDMTLSYSPEIPPMENVDISLKINNFLNRDIITNAYGGKYLEEGKEVRWSYYYPLAPLHFMAQIRLRF